MKLPDITYSKVSGPTNMRSPYEAVRSASERQQIVKAGFAAAEEIGNSYREFELKKHDSEYQNEMSDFRMKAASMKVATPADIKALGLDDIIDTEGKEFIPKSEWYPVALERKMEEAKGLYASRIKSPVDRTKWTQEMDTNNNKILLRETEIAARESEEHLKQLKQADIAADIDAGRYDSALGKLDSSVLDPVEMEALKSEILVSQAQHEDMVFRQTASAQELREMAVELRSDEKVRSDPRSAKDLDAAANTMEQLANIREREEEKQENDAYKDMLDEYWRTYGQSPSEMIANIPPDIRGEDMTRIMNWANTISQRGDIITNTKLYNDINIALSTDPDAWFAGGNRVQDFRAEFSREDLDRLLVLQKSMLRPATKKTDLPELKTYNQRLTLTYDVLGIDPDKEPDEAYAVNQIAENMIASRQAAKGNQKLTPDETREVFTEINRVSKTYSGIDGFLNSFGFDSKPSAKLTLADVDSDMNVTEQERITAVRAMEKAGIPMYPDTYKNAIKLQRKNPNE